MSNPKLTKANFAKAMMDVMKSVTTMQGEIQALIIFALNYAVESGNTQFLTMIRRESEKRPGIAVSKIDGYIRHMLPVHWAEGGDGKLVYKKTGKFEVNQSPAFKAWFKFERGDKKESVKRALTKVLETYACPGEDAAQPTKDDQLWAASILAELDAKAA